MLASTEVAFKKHECTRFHFLIISVSDAGISSCRLQITAIIMAGFDRETDESVIRSAGIYHLSSYALKPDISQYYIDVFNYSARFKSFTSPILTYGEIFYAQSFYYTYSTLKLNFYLFNGFE